MSPQAVFLESWRALVAAVSWTANDGRRSVTCITVGIQAGAYARHQDDKQPINIGGKHDQAGSRHPIQAD
jgi:hypothetical protein